jgi:hypothetical protein
MNTQSKDYKLTTVTSVEDCLAALRNDGWVVAAHYDYFQDGVLMTYWLLARDRDKTYIEGQALTDKTALNECLALAGLADY